MDRGTIHTSLPLSKVSAGFRVGTHIWSRVLLPVPVEKEQGLYYQFGQEFMRYQGKIRADKAESARVDSYSASQSEYACKEHSYHDIVTDRERNMADPVIQPDQRVTANTTKIVDLDIEADVANLVTTYTNYASGLYSTPSAANKWNGDVAEGTPIQDVDTAMTTVENEIGVTPNIMVVGPVVHDQLKRHPDILEYFKYTGRPFLTEALLAEVFGVDEYIVGKSSYITSKAGQSTVTKARIWGNFCALLFRPKMGALEEPAWGYTLLHKLFGGLTAMVQRIPAPDKGMNGVKIEVTRSYVPVITGKKAGYLFISPVNE